MKIPYGYDKYMILEAIDRYVVGMNAQRDREILKRKWVDGIKFESLSEEYDLSVRRTKDIVYKWRDMISNAHQQVS